MALDNKISNILGTKIPQWLINQLSTRAEQNSKSFRDNDNLIYLANKSAWVRLVSSINISDSDLNYFSKKVPNVNKPEDLAKQYVLFGGTSVYLNQNSYGLRSGISGIKPNAADNGAYGILGREEIQNYGYRPMPGITRVTIDTQGRLGSVRQAIIEIKCWDKAQLDIIDALYFKLGYTMFIEWGHTYYYPSAQNPNSTANQSINKLKSTELSISDPFAADLTKENIFRQISTNSRETEGNYDAMLGIVTNFNFSYNQEGGYDCTLRLMSLGVLGDSIKINNSSILPGILKDEVLILKNTLELQQNIGASAELALLAQQKEDALNDYNSRPDIYTYIQTRAYRTGQNFNLSLLNGKYNIVPAPKEGWIRLESEGWYGDIIREFGLLGSEYASTAPVTNQKYKYDFVFDPRDGVLGPSLFLQKFGVVIPSEDAINNYINGLSLNSEYFYQIIDGITSAVLPGNKQVGNQQIVSADGTVVESPIYEKDLSPKKTFIYDSLSRSTISSDKTINQEFKTIKIPYKGKNGKVYFISVNLDLNNVMEAIAPLNSEGIVAIDISGNKLGVAASDSSGRNQFQKTKNELALFVIDQFFLQKNRSIPFSFDAESVSIKFISKADIKTTVESLIGSKLFPQVYNQITTLDEVIRRTNSLVSSQNSGYEISVNGEFFINSNVYKIAFSSEVTENREFSIPFTITFDDTSLIQSVDISNVSKDFLFAETFKARVDDAISKQNQIEQQQAEAQKNSQDALSSQILSSLSYQSALEILLRTIQVKALTEAFYNTSTAKGKPDLEIGRKVYTFEIFKRPKFVNQIFSNGVYQNIIDTLINNPSKISNTNYKTDDDQFAVNAKYGFATTLLGSNSKSDEIFKAIEGKEVNYKDILKAYVVPYQIDQDLIAGVKTNHPVYIPLGLLCVLLNHICTLYDAKAESNLASAGGGIQDTLANALNSVNQIVAQKQKPLVYIDYNPNLNFFFTNPQQLSTNPWTVLIPYEGTFDDYKKLFNPDVIEGNSITPPSGSNDKTPLFNPQNQDLLSFYLPKIKDGSKYRGKLMNVLLNIDYLANLVRDYSYKDGSNNVYLKPFLEQILSDVNKYLGNFNTLRLSYNDIANTFQIVDDQLMPSITDEAQISPFDNRTEIPLVGVNSIARSLELKTEISSKLANMLAISSNSNPKEQVQSSTNGDSFSFANSNYVDRYIPRKIAAGNAKSSQKDGEIVSSIQFNQTVSDFYSKINPSYSDVSQVTSFFIDKMSVVKNNDIATRSSAMIPVGITFSTDGIGGLCMGQAFTVSNELLPYNYYSKKPGNIFDGYLNQVGFVFVGLTHTIENNSWLTSVRTQMLPVKDATVFKGAPAVLQQNTGEFNINPSNDVGSTTNADWLRGRIKEYGYQEKGNELSIGGDITRELAIEVNALFEAIYTKFGSSVVIQITGGNDLHHKNLNSQHKFGKGLDFILLKGNVNEVSAFIEEFKNKTALSFNNEYDENKQSPNATGNHFHVQIA